mmetsp:Transcript_39611/g.119715  ORF Transcript_39611/g.119715 Transcript_39611/m.119715 type:complete len:209 (+) Transcript_39611:143-769(+)
MSTSGSQKSLCLNRRFTRAASSGSGIIIRSWATGPVRIRVATSPRSITERSHRASPSSCATKGRIASARYIPGAACARGKGATSRRCFSTSAGIARTAQRCRFGLSLSLAKQGLFSNRATTSAAWPLRRLPRRRRGRLCPRRTAPRPASACSWTAAAGSGSATAGRARRAAPPHKVVGSTISGPRIRQSKHTSWINGDIRKKTEGPDS